MALPMISLHFTTRLPGFTLEAECDLPGDDFTAVLGPSDCGTAPRTAASRRSQAASRVS